MKWEFGPCSSGDKQGDYKQYTQRCCMKPGNYTLTCDNTEKPEGWKGGYLESLAIGIVTISWALEQGDKL